MHGVVEKIFEPASKEGDDDKKTLITDDPILKKLELPFNPMEQKEINVEFPSKKKIKPQFLYEYTNFVELSPSEKPKFKLKTHRKESKGWDFLNDGESVVDTNIILPTYPLTTK